MGENLSVFSIGRNLGDIEKPAVIKPGKYRAEVMDVDQTKSAKGNEKYDIQFIIPPDSYPASQSDELNDSYPDGITMTWSRYTVPRSERDGRALYNLRRLYIALGLDPNVEDIDPQDWMGQECLLQIEKNMWEGEERAQIRALLPLDEDGGEVEGEATEEDAEEEAPPARRKPAAKPKPTPRRGR